MATYSDHQQRMLDQGRSIEQVRQHRPRVTVTTTWRNGNPDTIWNRLAARLGREPTNAEAEAEVKRILAEAR
jgi:hypothetical protein